MLTIKIIIKDGKEHANFCYATIGKLHPNSPFRMKHRHPSFTNVLFILDIIGQKNTDGTHLNLRKVNKAMAGSRRVNQDVVSCTYGFDMMVGSRSLLKIIVLYSGY